MLEMLISQLQAGSPPGDLDYDTMQVLLAPDGTSGIQLGYSVSISDDGRIVALGARTGRTGSVNTGAVYVYEKTGDSYTWIQKLTASDGAANDNFGFSVSVSGDGSIVVVGAYGDDDKGSSSGSVYVFKHIGSSYSQVQKLTASDGAAVDNFGFSVAIAGDGAVIVIGSYRDDDKGTDSGSVYVFRYNGSNYIQVQKLTASDGAMNDYFGWSIAISGDGATIIIGSYRDDDKGGESGSVYVFKYDGQSYQEIKKLTGNKDVDSGSFGYSVTIASDTQQIAVGARQWADASNVATGAGFVFS